MRDERRREVHRADGQRWTFSSLVILSASVLVGCATPLRPSGGPEDRTPPALVSSTPSAGAVRVTDRRLTLTFSERVDEASARRALSIAPAPATPPDVRVRGSDVEVVLVDSLRSDITYVLTLGTELRDLRGVAIAAPVTIAFATGDRIDEGRLRGFVRSGATGRSMAGAAVMAYRLGADSASGPPDPRVVRADYRTQSGSDGAFSLTHLRPGLYFVVSLDDRNRDGLAGAGEAFAVPPSRGEIAADTGAAPAPLSLFITRVDTTAPALRGAAVSRPGVVTARFDEPVRLGPGARDAFVIQDSSTARQVPIRAAWSAGVGSREIALAADPGPSRHRLQLVRPEAIVDSAGNHATAGEVRLSGATPREEAARAQFVAFLPEAGVAPDSAYTLRPDELPAVRFDAPVDSLEVSRQITASDASGAAVPVRVSMPTPSTLELDIAAADFTVTVMDSTHRRRYRRLSRDEVGGITGHLDSAGAGVGILEAFPSGGGGAGARPYTARVGADGTVTLAGLPPGSYRVRVFLDDDGDGSWDGGRLHPYETAENLGWLPDPVRVRARWDTDLGTIRIIDGVLTAEGAAQQE